VVDPASLPALMPEFAPYEGLCRFSGCMHVSEPGCAVKQAAAEGAISPERLRRYTEIFAETREKWRKRYD
jgi:ribosome biogenesis GTPase